MINVHLGHITKGEISNVICFFKIVNLFLENVFCVIAAGGCNTKTAVRRVEVLTGDFGTKRLQNLPHHISFSSMGLQNKTILLCGGMGNITDSLQLDNGTWKKHSTLDDARLSPRVVTTEKTTFLFGGDGLNKTYVYLPKNSNTWLKGKNDIPGGFWLGCAIAVKSEKEILLIGGLTNRTRILSFNVNDHTFQELPIQLNVARYGHNCAYIPNTNKIMITGGYLDSSEILDTANGNITMASRMNSNRKFHGMGVITINGEDKLAVLGGSDGRTKLDSVEVYNTKTQKWETTDLKLSDPKDNFGFLTVNLGDIISNLKITRNAGSFTGFR